MYKYRDHLEKVHKIILPKLQKSTENPDISPDINDPNFYCKSCQTKYKSRRNYRAHLRHKQKMQLTPLKKQTTFDSTISVGDTKKPDNTSCSLCKYTYTNKNSYQKTHEQYSQRW